MTTVII